MIDNNQLESEAIVVKLNFHSETKRCYRFEEEKINFRGTGNTYALWNGTLYVNKERFKRVPKTIEVTIKTTECI